MLHTNHGSDGLQQKQGFSSFFIPKILSPPLSIVGPLKIPFQVTDAVFHLWEYPGMIKLNDSTNNNNMPVTEPMEKQRTNKKGEHEEFPDKQRDFSGFFFITWSGVLGCFKPNKKEGIVKVSPPPLYPHTKNMFGD